jgi:hypothetical protein
MYVRKIIAAASVVVVIITTGNCAGGAPPLEPATATPLEIGAAAAGRAAARPFSGRCETTFNPPPLPPPPVHRQTDQGSCQLAHLGRAEFYSVKDIDFSTGTQTTTEASFTAPNGDVLRAVGAGTSAPGRPGHIAFSATLTLQGGTGRFAHATGWVRVEGEADLAARTASMQIVEGWIAYDGSDRSGF